MQLSAQQVRQYNDAGYVIVESFFSGHELAAMLAELDRFKREGMIHNVATEGDGATISGQALNLQIIPLNDKSTLFRSLPFAGKVRTAVEQLLDGPFVRYLDQIFLKPGRHGAGTNWHQDNAYFHVDDPTRGVGMWTALHDAHRANGTLELIPASHRAMLDHRRDPGSNHHVTCTVDETRAVPVEIKAGGVAFFNWGIAHCTRGNRTSHERAGLAYHFLRTDAVPQARWHDPSPPVMVTGPGATHGRKEYGADMRGAWACEIGPGKARE